MRVVHRRDVFASIGTVLALMLALACQGVVLAAPRAHANPGVTCRPGACQGTYYGANLSAMAIATQGWPQFQSNWCGIANVQAIMRYAWWVDTGQAYPTNWAQTDIHNLMMGDGAVSPWGLPSNPNVWADISNDFGTDPRAIAWAAWDTTPNGYYYHNYIYQTNSNAATHNIALDFGAHGYSQPISATVFHGGHSLVVSGVYAASDPSNGVNTTLYGIYTWDPGVGAGVGVNSTVAEVWSMTDWTTSSSLYSAYSANGVQDPDPSTPTNYYNPPFPNYGNQQHHWIGYWVSIERDFVRVCNSYGPNYSLDQNGNPSPHNGTC